MKLARYVERGTSRLGAVVEERVLDLGLAWAAFQRSAGPVAPGAGEECPATMEALLNCGAAAVRVAGEVVDWAAGLAAAGGEGLWWALDEVRLEAPLRHPGKIICVGRNYYDHAREAGQEVPERPVLFCKFPSAIIGPGDAISWPADVTQAVDYEAELAAVIGRAGRDVPVEEALAYVAGYTNLNDVTARDLQRADGQWVRSKSLDTFCPLGPYLVTGDEVPDPHCLAIRSRVNGEVRQESNTRELIFDVPHLVAFISRTATLLPGDIISTGTPGGVGVYRDPPVFLAPGDVVEVEVEGLGKLCSPVGRRAAR